MGIDLGTSNTCVALCVGPKPEVIANQQGERTTPSVVAFAEDGKILVGSPAYRQAVMNPRRTITGVKRLVGHHYNSAVIKDLERTLPYSLVASDIGDAWVQIDNQRISPQEIQAYVLERVRDDANRFVNGKVPGAVVTVPAFFDEIQRQAVRDAAEIAGFDSARILSEPTAAALAYGYAQLDNRRIVVADFGGGTLDITVMSVDRGRFEVLATDGDLLLGGHDFDRMLATAFAGEIRDLHGVDVLQDAVAVQRLISEAEAAKRTLSQEASVTISLPYLSESKNGPIHFEKNLTRTEFDHITKPLVDRIVSPCHKVLKQAGLQVRQVDEVILVGGMTRTPAIQKKIGEMFDRKPSLRVNPDEVVAMGASLLGAGKARQDITFVDVTPRAIGLRVAGNQMSTLIPKSTALPAKVTKAFATTQDNQDFFELEVLQGEDSAAAKNRQLAVVRIEPIPRKRAGDVKLKVTFEIDTDGHLGVSALEMGSQKETSATIRPLSGLTRKEVEELRARHGHAAHVAAAAAPQESPVPVQAGFSIQFGTRSQVAEGTPRPERKNPPPAAVQPRAGSQPAPAAPPPPMRSPTPPGMTAQQPQMGSAKPPARARTAPAAQKASATRTGSMPVVAVTAHGKSMSRTGIVLFAAFLTLILAAVIGSVIYLG